MKNSKAKGDNNNTDKRKREENDANAEPYRAFVRVHPSGAAIAVAVGTELRIYSKIDDKVHTLLSQSQSKDSSDPIGAVRDICFSRCGSYFACGGDDKLGRLWSCDSWQLLTTVKSQKKVSTVNFSADGKFVLFGNKFGDVLVTSTNDNTTNTSSNNTEILMGHYCSILTSLSLSHTGKYFATTDRDAKTRVSIMPDKPMQGSNEIQSYCFGHTMFVTCSAFIMNSYDKELLVTGSGDGTVRLWDYMNGRMLCTLAVGLTAEQQKEQREVLLLQDEPQGQGQNDGDNGDNGDNGDGDDNTNDNTNNNNTTTIKPTPILSIQPSHDGTYLLVLLDGEPSVRLVSVDYEKESLTLLDQTYSIPSMPMISDIQLDPGSISNNTNNTSSSNRFWIVGGPVSAHDSDDIIMIYTSLDINTSTNTVAVPQFHVVQYSDSPFPSLNKDDVVNELLKCGDIEKKGGIIVPRTYIPGYLNKRSFMFNKKARKGDDHGDIEEKV